MCKCLHKLPNGIDCAPKTALPAENLHQIYIFRDFLMQKYKPPRFATVYVPARRLYEFDILRRFAMLNAR